MAELQLSQAELDERVAILKRFRSLLEKQRAKFQEYLNVLEKQEAKIAAQDADAIIAHTELEANIIENIGSLQKVIDPMEKLYQTSKAASYNLKDAIPVQNLKEDLAKLQSQVLIQNEKNRNLLKLHIVEIKQQINEMKNPYFGKRSIYASDANLGSVIQINA